MDKWLKRSHPGPSSSSSSSEVFKTSVSEGDEERVDRTPTELNATASVQPSSTSSSKKVKRKYDPTYLAFGFTYTGDENEPIPQCVVCMETLSKHSMKPSLLMRHFNTKRCNLKGKPVYFKNNENEIKGIKTAMSSYSSVNMRAVEPSYKVSLRIAQDAKPHTIGKSLVLPAAKDVVSSIFGEKEAKQLDVVSLSNDTVSRRIKDMALAVKFKLIEKIKDSPYFSLQIDETADVTIMPNLLCYVRYEDSSGIKEDMLFCEILPKHTTAGDIC